MKVAAVLDKSQKVINRVVLDVGDWNSPDGQTVIETEKTGASEIGGTFDGAAFVKAPISPLLSPPPPSVDALISDLGDVLLKVILNHENRLRGLEAKAPVTMAQLKTALKALL